MRRGTDEAHYQDPTLWTLRSLFTIRNSPGHPETLIQAGSLRTRSKRDPWPKREEDPPLCPPPREVRRFFQYV